MFELSKTSARGVSRAIALSALLAAAAWLPVDDTALAAMLAAAAWLPVDDTALAACPAPGTPISLTTGTRTESGCTITTTGAGQTAASASGASTLNLSNTLITTTGTNAGGTSVSGAGSVLNETNDTIVTETGTGVTVGTGATGNFSGLSIKTNASQQNLVPLLTGLPEYPLLGAGDPMTRDYSLDSAILDLWAIASPAKGASISGTAVFNGSTNIVSGTTGIALASGASATVNGPLTIRTGPGGTTSTYAYGIQVGASAILDINSALDITVDSVAGSGIRTDTASTATIDSAGGAIDIKLTNATNVGINNVNEAAGLYAAGGSIAVTGDLSLDAMQGRGYGLWTGANATASIIVNGDTDIATHGAQAFGMRLDNGLIDLNGDLDIVTGVAPSNADARNGAGSAGLRAILGTLDVSGATNITTIGGIDLVGGSSQTREASYGIWNTSYSRLAGNGASLTFGGPVTISTGGEAAHAIYNDSVNGTMLFNGPVTINTTGGPGSVTWYRTLGIIAVNETVGAWGVNSAISGTTTFADPLSITTSGSTSGGVRSTGGTISMQDGATIRTSGASAYGIYGSGTTSPVFNGTITAGGPVDIATTGAGSHAIFADRSASITLTGGARLRVADTVAKTILSQANSVITGSGVFDVVGDMQSDNTSRLTLTFAPGSRFVGTTTRTGTSTFDLTLQDSLWTMTGNSNLSTLVNDPSLIQFTPPTGDPTLLASYKTLTVVNYIGDGGNIGLNTYLGSDGSPSDRLIIDGGTATGTGGLIVRDTMGGGALTTANGILVVDAINGGSTAPSAFHLAAPAVAGPYEYSLYRSSLDASAPESWYLRSELAPSPPGPGPDPTPDYRPEVSLYAAVPSMAAIYGRHIIDTLHERVGEEEQLRGRTDIGEDEKFNGFWMRGIGQWGHRNGDPRGIYDGAPEYDYRFGAIQGGLDFYREEKDDITDHAGLYLAYGHGVMDVTQDRLTMTRDAGRNAFNAFSLGGYWTRFGEEGWYLDGVLQGTWYGMKTRSERATEIGFPDQDIDGFGFAASLEGGYPFDLGNGWQLEPQGQLIWQTVHMDDFNDGAADIRYDNLNSLAGRIGARIARTWEAEEATASEPARLATVWGRINLWHEFTAKAQTDISSADGFVPFSSDLDETWIEFGIGGTREVSKNTSLYGNVNFSTSFDGDNYAWTGKVGVRVNW